MVRKLEIESLTAELASVEGLLRQRNEEEDPIGHFQFSQRVEDIQQKLQAIQQTPELSARIALFFAGAPVIGSRGIKAEFAGSAIEQFQDVVAKRLAAVEIGELGRRGPVPLRMSSDLLLTDVARGSFGVILEESIENESLAETPLKTVLDDVVHFMRAASQEDGELFDELLETVDDRYLRSLGNFFELLDESGATLRVVEGDEDRQLHRDEVHRARERTTALQIDERGGVQLVGTLYLLPAHRRFELVLESGENIWGPVSREFATAHLEALRAANEVVGRRWRVRTRARTVTRPNREPKTTHTLLGLIERLD